MQAFRAARVMHAQASSLRSVRYRRLTPVALMKFDSKHTCKTMKRVDVKCSAPKREQQSAGVPRACREKAEA